ncbi:MFS transporter [Mailhella sp.]|uniref:MFS transporter n=1 Tax=Mailhella sp. TaxID=1981029 RepID=UPI003AB242AD
MESTISFSPSAKARWSAVFSLFMGVTCLISAEFIPVSLLTPIADGLSISEGMAGQTVTSVGALAMLTSLLLAPMTRHTDRRRILLLLSALLLVSNLTVAFASNYAMLLLGRGLLGVCVGGFWSMASAVTIQLVPQKDIPRALSVLYSGVSVATIVALPLASLLEELFGWRNVFLLSAVPGLLSLIWQYLALPSLPPRPGNDFRGMRSLLSVRWAATGIAATIFGYGGYHSLFTYLRPYLEHGLALTPTSLSVMLLAYGAANTIGTFTAGVLLNRNFRFTMIGMHASLAAMAVILFFFRDVVPVSLPLLLLWGFFFGMLCVGWTAWIALTLADKAEIAGGLSVAAIQFSIGSAAAFGGHVYDASGMAGIFLTAAVILAVATLLTVTSFSFYRRDTGKKL